MSVADLYVPIEDGTNDCCYISRSYDATSHFETTTDDVKDIYRRVMGKPLIVKEKLRPTQVSSYQIPEVTVRRKNRIRLPFKNYRKGLSILLSPVY